jgi:hypothetical protein
MINKKKLCRFLVKAKRCTYAAGDAAQKVMESDQSTTLTFFEGDFKYHDNYFGGEPYGGREVVFFKNRPVFMMVYYGLVDESVSDFGEVYSVLQGALSLIPENHPFRGPDEYVKGESVYRNVYEGEIDKFQGVETITVGDKEVYKATYFGGFVDKRK